MNLYDTLIVYGNDILLSYFVQRRRSLITEIREVDAAIAKIKLLSGESPLPNRADSHHTNDADKASIE